MPSSIVSCSSSERSSNHDPVRAIRFVCPKLSNTGCPLRCERVGAWAIRAVISSGSRLSSQNLRQSVALDGCPPNQVVPSGELGGEPLGIVVYPPPNRGLDCACAT